MIEIWQITKKHIVEFWEKGGRWYWHEKARNGNVLASGNYKYRRSCRRALRQMFGEPS